MHMLHVLHALTWLQSVMSLLERIISSTFSQSWPSSGPPSTVHTLLWSRTIELRRWTGQPPVVSRRRTTKHIKTTFRFAVQCRTTLYSVLCIFMSCFYSCNIVLCTWFVAQGRLRDMAIVRRRQCIASHRAVVH